MYVNGLIERGLKASPELSDLWGWASETIKDVYTNAKQRWKREPESSIKPSTWSRTFTLTKSTNPKGAGAITGTVPMGKSLVRSDRRASAEGHSGKE
jgi:hypothetical protein